MGGGPGTRVTDIMGKEIKMGDDAGGWPTIMVFTQELGYEGQVYQKHTDDPMHVEIGPNTSHLDDWMMENIVMNRPTFRAHLKKSEISISADGTATNTGESPKEKKFKPSAKTTTTTPDTSNGHLEKCGADGNKIYNCNVTDMTKGCSDEERIFAEKWHKKDPKEMIDLMFDLEEAWHNDKDTLPKEEAIWLQKRMKIIQQLVEVVRTANDW